MNITITKDVQSGFAPISAFGDSRLRTSSSFTTAELGLLETSEYAFAAGVDAAIDAAICVHPQGSAMAKAENRWAHTPKFGNTYHFQRWKFTT